MTTASAVPPTLADHLGAPLRVGAPDIAGALAVFPVYGPAPRLEYRSFAQGCTLGVTIKELGSGASVNDLVVANPTDKPVLLYEGEEVLGAQQNRTFDVSVLVGAMSSAPVPVSCVEQGRWDGSRHGEAFRPAPQAAYPSLRRMKNEQAGAQRAAGGEARAQQGAVWSEVAAKSARLSVDSPTRAMHDVFERRRGDLRAYEKAIRLHDGQTGAIVVIAGEIAVLDLVSRPDAFASLHGPLVHGYALDALEAETEAPPPRPVAPTLFLSRVLGAPLTHRDGIGLGSELRFRDAGVGGAGLVALDELVQLTAFPAQGSGARAAITRPSRRQRGT